MRHAMQRSSAAVTAAVFAGVLVVATPSYASNAPSNVPHRTIGARAAGPQTVALSVMSQNIFYGGDDYDLKTGDFCKIADGCPQALTRLAGVIKQAGADVVGVQEAERNTRRLAGLLGWYASPRAHVISRSYAAMSGRISDDRPPAGQSPDAVGQRTSAGAGEGRARRTPRARRSRHHDCQRHSFRSHSRR